MASDGSPLGLAEALRAHRRAAGLSQERLAERSGVSVRTIGNIERASVGVPRLMSLQALADALDLQGGEREWFMGFGASRGEGGVGVDGGSPVPVPLTRLVGRDAEVASLTQLLLDGTVRLVTVTGVAGVGKTRLAQEVARRLQSGGRRTWWVPLASIDDVRRVLDAVAGAVGSSVVSPEAVAGRIGRDQALLVLDNVEHLAGIGEVLSELLHLSSSLTVLATSRAPVGVRGEQEWPLGPLAVPGPDEVDPALLASVGSVQMLLERVRAVLPDFEITATNGVHMAEICRLVDGLPLAVELAARQWRVRGGAGLVRSIRGDPLALRDISDPAVPGHASLEAALGASHGLLTDAEQRTFGCFSVFPSSWGMEAAVAVDGGGRTVDHLDRLVALGLVVASNGDSDTDTRFSMLPTVRAFAAAKARETRTAETAMARLALHFHEWVTEVTAKPELPGSLLEAERDNLRAALDWLRDHEPRAGLEMAVSMCPHWRRQGREEEGLSYLEGLLPRVDDAELVAGAQLQAAAMAHVAGRLELAARLAEQSLAAHRALDDSRGCAEALGTLGMAALVTDPLASLAHCQEAVSLAEQLEDAPLLGRLLQELGVALGQVGRLDEAISAHQRALEVIRASDASYQGDRRQERRVEIVSLVYIADYLVLQGRFLEADRVLDAAEPLVGGADDLAAETVYMALRVVVGAGLGDLEGASTLMPAVTEMAAETGSSLFAEWALWSRGELEIAEGDHGRAAATFRQAIAMERRHGYPLSRIGLLAGLAVAAPDIDTAAHAVAAVELIADGHAIPIPETPARRLEAARDRWVRAEGTEAWIARVTAASSRHVDDIIDDILTPQPDGQR